MRRLLLTLLTLSALPASAQEAAKPEAPKDVPAEARPEARSKTRYFEGMGRTPQDEAVLQELSRAIQTYEEASREYRREVQLLVEKKYEEKRSALSGSYEQALRELEINERKERLDAIARFEAFLKRYPSEPKYTPDVMFRLAELYYERSSDEHLTAMREYDEKLKTTPASSEPPSEPAVDFAPSIALYRRLIDGFPDYRLNDGAWYLLGYCLEKQNAFEQGLAAYQQLIQRYPKSRFTTEAWVRIGEYYFDAFNEAEALTKAADAYENATRDTTHPLYDKALYKLGWTYYRMDRFDDAVARFLTLADFYEAKKAQEGDDAGGGDLREEALQYVAVSLADEKWGGMAKAQALFAERGPRAYEADLYRRLGNVWFDQTNHTAAIEAYRLVLAKDPLATDAPQIQQRIVQAYERDRKLAESFTEAERLAALYAPGSAWYAKNKDEPEALSAADALAEKSLYTSAIYHHQQALVFKQEGKFVEAKHGFEVAARAYGGYLERFPRSKGAYEIRFYYAECLYNSLQFVAAARQYGEVRDSSMDKRFLKDAAFSAVVSWQLQLAQEYKAGTAKELKPLRSNERPEGEVLQPVALAPSEAKLVAASDAYVAKLPQDEKAPGIAYKAAELFYAHNDFPEARRRFEAIVQTYPKSEVAKYSTNLIVETFLITKDWRSVEETSARLASNTDVIDPKSDLHKDLVRFKLAGRFKLADQLMQLGQYEEAAQKYIQLVDEEPKHEFADKALNNAAVCFENTRRFDSALKLYERIFREYPASTLADAALFRVAVNAENSYDFDKAVASYQRLVKDYPASKDREAALFNAARLLEGQQRYAEAASAFLRYADLFPKADDAPRNQYRAALILEKQEDWRGEIRALEEFIAKFASKTAQVELVVEARKRIGDAHKKLGNEKDALRAWGQAADEFDRRKLKPDTHPIAANAAAYSRFQQAEEELQKFDRLKIGGKGKALENSFTAKRNAVKAVNTAYARVYPYKQLEWTLAALYRNGYTLERFATTIIETPVPPDVKKLGDEAVVAYQDLLAQQTTALEDKAVESYSATLVEARKNRISNEWTRRTLESLNRFRPKEFPVLKEPKVAIAHEAVYPEGLVGQMTGPSRAPSQPPQRLTGGGEK